MLPFASQKPSSGGALALQMLLEALLDLKI